MEVYLRTCTSLVTTNGHNSVLNKYLFCPYVQPGQILIFKQSTRVPMIDSKPSWTAGWFFVEPSILWWSGHFMFISWSHKPRSPPQHLPPALAEEVMFSVPSVCLFVHLGLWDLHCEPPCAWEPDYIVHHRATLCTMVYKGYFSFSAYNQKMESTVKVMSSSSKATRSRSEGQISGLWILLVMGSGRCVNTGSFLIPVWTSMCRSYSFCQGVLEKAANWCSFLFLSVHLKWRPL